MAISNPTDISDLVHWYDASDTGSITDSSGDVTVLAAQVGNDLDDVVGTPRTGDDTLNSLNVITFDGASRLKGNPIGGATSAAFTLFCVGQITGSTGGNQFLCSAQGADSSGIVGVNGSNWGVNSTNIVESSDATDTDAHYFIYVSNGSSSSLWIDGTEYALGSDPGGNGYASDGVWGANAYDGAYLSGIVGETGVYSRVLNGTELADLNSYMASKWFGIGGGGSGSVILLIQQQL